MGVSGDILGFSSQVHSEVFIKCMWGAHTGPLLMLCWVWSAAQASSRTGWNVKQSWIGTEHWRLAGSKLWGPFNSHVWVHTNLGATLSED